MYYCCTNLSHYKLTLVFTSRDVHVTPQYGDTNPQLNESSTSTTLDNKPTLFTFTGKFQKPSNKSIL